MNIKAYLSQSDGYLLHAIEPTNDNYTQLEYLSFRCTRHLKYVMGSTQGVGLIDKTAQQLEFMLQLNTKLWVRST